MNQLYQDILRAIANDQRLLAVLLDPDKLNIAQIPELIEKIHSAIVTHIFVGGSTMEADVMPAFVKALKAQTHLPVILFPGDTSQITSEADALLFLTLLSGRNPEYLIGQQVKAVEVLRKEPLEIIPTAYLLVESGKETAVQRVSKTQPLDRSDVQTITDTAKAGELMGMKLVYLEGGSGAQSPISSEIIQSVSSELSIPTIVGGGLRSAEDLELAYESGAQMVVIGTAFEKNPRFFEALQNKKNLSLTKLEY